ncbi:MAG: hypothetical protein AB8E15_06200 [Bdellovibrionales bacterium]
MADDRLFQLLDLPEDERTPEWEIEFFKWIVSAQVDLVYPDPKPGPDTWPYMLLEVKPDGKESFLNILSWSVERGIGLVINPMKDLPDYVFPFGMLWFFKETGGFLSDNLNYRPTELRIEEGKQYYTGNPNEQYLPLYVRDILKEFFQQQGVLAPKLMMLSEDQEVWDLVFSQESLGNPPSHELAGVAEAIAWFLPQHYAVAILSESAMSGFHKL